jgi:hypothetical protein
MIEFRTLNADEIECRVARCTEKGAQLLLYKDARCDMNILDETVGAENWQRQHDDHNGNLFCSVGINCGGHWIFKEDAGAESNTEAEKGHASDSFKRACVNWGIGRELYTSPFIWVNGVSKEVKGKWVCNEKFTVSAIGYNEKRQINELVIVDKTGATVYQMGKPVPAKPDMMFRCEDCGAVLKPYKNKAGEEVGVRRAAEVSKNKYGRCLCVECIKKIGENG